MTETFPIIPAHTRTLWFIVPIIGILLAAGTTLFLSMRGPRNARFEVSSVGLRLRGDLYGKMIAASALRLDEARPVDLNVETGLAPRTRTVGTALPGYRAGWFRLRDGQKALLYLTDPTRVAYVPTTDGYSVLVSVPDPDSFVASLRRHAHGSNRKSSGHGGLDGH